ncbi:hypothetical protein MATL_G00093370 [Megalops atlanticus]|uniref:VPS9 domain-containing protein n=1 Tax=Megalops atlanticus TaxID=7932 RepID=A0A9D3TCW1_MEGAT|nr:hypothetical protein MATL_G00093370 [Megalops atlanticus]
MASGALDGGLRPLQIAMKLANAAVELEAGERHKEAYCEYLRSINYISQTLLEDAVSKPDGEMVTMEVERMLRLAEQCLERVKSYAGRRSDIASSSLLWPRLPPRPQRRRAEKGGDVAPKTSPRPAPGHRRVLSDGSPVGDGVAAPFLPPEIFHKLQEAESYDAKKELTPIEEASRLNQKLKATYEARLARLPPGQATQKTSLTLSLQRQMMENLIIAKARQDALHRKMEERRLRLQEEANRRFAGSGLITPEEQEQRLLYANVLEYEQDHDWPKLWKAKMKKDPGDAALVAGLIAYLLSCPDHPVMKLLKRLQYRIYNRLYPISETSFDGVSRDLNANEEDPAPASEAPPSPRPRDGSFEDLERYLATPDLSPAPGPAPGPDDDARLLSLEERALREHLRTIVKDVHNAVDRLLSLCLLSFECLNTASAKDVCLASIEEAFFAPLWRPLLALFRKVHRDREQAFEAGVRLYRDAAPGDVGVAPKLFPSDPAALQGSYPYEAAVLELQQLSRDTCPQKKLECIVRTLRLICVCAEEYRTLQDPDAPPSTAAIGADDLLPILSFVALRSALPQLVSECAALEEFIHEGYLIGEEGYCLTSMQSALSYVESLGGGAPHR